LVATVESEFGGVDVLINNAGKSIRRPQAESLDRWHDVERTTQRSAKQGATSRCVRSHTAGFVGN
jgi:NAD(P)-dependent dehydrogenase (short-subunit alcohol dehydrogenase family)